MTSCAVLRCSRQGSVVFNVNEGAMPLIEAWICSKHKEDIDKGARWVWQPSNPTTEILMDRDLPRLLTGLDIHSGPTSNVQSSTFLRLHLEQADGSPQDLEVQVPPEHARYLSQHLNWMNRARDERG